MEAAILALAQQMQQMSATIQQQQQAMGDMNTHMQHQQANVINLTQAMQQAVTDQQNATLHVAQMANAAAATAAATAATPPPATSSTPTFSSPDRKPFEKLRTPDIFKADGDYRARGQNGRREQKQECGHA